MPRAHTTCWRSRFISWATFLTLCTSIAEGRPSPRVFVKLLLPVAIGNEVAVNAGQNVIMTCAGVHHVLGKQLHWWKCRVDGDCELVHTGKHLVFPAVTPSNDGDYVCGDGQIRSEPMKLIVNTNTQRPQSQGSPHSHHAKTRVLPTTWQSRTFRSTLFRIPTLPISVERLSTDSTLWGTQQQSVSDEQSDDTMLLLISTVAVTVVVLVFLLGVLMFVVICRVWCTNLKAFKLKSINS
ncbi:uncharacterized protein LOC134177302 isoform X2 [Corticium candelabrum]|nr:uncharacterized protein LOC134177302 isoform X2 [Corticium candelabrum]